MINNDSLLYLYSMEPEKDIFRKKIRSTTPSLWFFPWFSDVFRVEHSQWTENISEGLLGGQYNFESFLICQVSHFRLKCTKACAEFFWIIQSQHNCKCLQKKSTDKQSQQAKQSNTARDRPVPSVGQWLSVALFLFVAVVHCHVPCLL